MMGSQRLQNVIETMKALGASKSQVRKTIEGEATRVINGGRDEW
jgi:DNA-binding transcriptional regulator YhcF (GntR family)